MNYAITHGKGDRRSLARYVNVSNICRTVAFASRYLYFTSFTNCHAAVATNHNYALSKPGPCETNYT